MKWRTIGIFLTVVIVLLTAGICLWRYACYSVASEGLSISQGSLVFRSFGGTETMYLILQSNNTYSLLARAHMGTFEFDHGTWTQDEIGEMTLESQTNTNSLSHIRAVRYKSWVVLVSPDHDFISIWAESIEEVQKTLDQTEPDKTPLGLFIQVNSEKAAEEAISPQPFIFYPELNKPRPHAITLHKESPLAPNKTNSADAKSSAAD